MGLTNDINEILKKIKKINITSDLTNIYEKIEKMITIRFNIMQQQLENQTKIFNVQINKLDIAIKNLREYIDGQFLHLSENTQKFFADIKNTLTTVTKNTFGFLDEYKQPLLNLIIIAIVVVVAIKLGAVYGLVWLKTKLFN